MDREQAEVKLQKWFKLPAFYDEQWRAIERLLAGDLSTSTGLSQQ